MLAWAPVLGDLYSTVAGGFIVVQGARAGVSAPILGGAGLLMACRTIVGAIPIAGSAFADVFTAHKWGAAMIVRAIDRRLGEPTARHTPWVGAPSRSRPAQAGGVRIAAAG